MPAVRHQDATIYYEEFGQGFLILDWRTGAALTAARARVKEFLSKHTP
jgi:hypothetical protein